MKRIDALDRTARADLMTTLADPSMNKIKTAESLPALEKMATD